MTIRMTDTEAHLEGDWTYDVVTQHMDALALSLKRIESLHGNNFRINCGQVNDADANGLQILQVWMECVRMRGVEPKLVNISRHLQHTMQVCNFRSCFKG